MSEPKTIPESSEGFSCSGPCFIPGLLAIPLLHIGLLTACVSWTRTEGMSSIVLGIAFGLFGVFWLTFLILTRWLGGRATINLLGFASYGLVWLGIPVAIVWWLAG